jgi:hypothetical protein
LLRRAGGPARPMCGRASSRGARGRARGAQPAWDWSGAPSSLREYPWRGGGRLGVARGRRPGDLYSGHKAVVRVFPLRSKVARSRHGTPAQAAWRLSTATSRVAGGGMVGAAWPWRARHVGRGDGVWMAVRPRSGVHGAHGPMGAGRPRHAGPAGPRREHRATPARARALERPVCQQFRLSLL